MTFKKELKRKEKVMENARKKNPLVKQKSYYGSAEPQQDHETNIKRNFRK